MESNLLSLKAELKLEVLDKLPAKEVQKLRIVCKDLKNFVDENKVKIANVKIGQERKRIVDHLNYCVFYTDNPTFMEKLSRCYNLRGIWRCQYCYNHLGPSIVAHAAPGSFSDVMSSNEWMEYVKGLAAADHARHLQDGPSTSRSKLFHFLIKLLTAIEISRGIKLHTDSDSIERLCNEVIDEASGLFHSEHHAENEHYETTQPKLQLSGVIYERHGIGDRSTEIVKMPIAGVCSPTELCEFFGLPELPNMGFFAYCLNDNGLYKRLRYAFRHPSNTSVITEPMFKAAVMEYMFVF